MNTEHKHTKGPWKIHSTKQGYPYQIETSDGRPITRWGCFIKPTSEESHANARLIAAAPDLLEAVEHATGFISAMCELAGIEDDIILNARRKDTGESYELRLSDIIQHATDTLGKVYGESARAGTGKGVEP